MIKKISWNEISQIWNDHLWPNRQSPIETNSAMTYLGGYDLRNMEYPTTYFGYFVDDMLVGVNSGHNCTNKHYRSRGLWVNPSFRNQGIGKTLLAETIIQGKKEGNVLVWSYPRLSSWNVYSKIGFQLSSDWEKSETSDANAFCYIKLT